jgi:hypothetical protein
MLTLSLRLAAALPLLGVASVALSAPVPFQADPFTDVPNNHPYYEAIDFMRTQSVVRGYLDGSFKPLNRINRAEMAQLITNPLFLNAEGLTECSNASSSEGVPVNPYSDVNKEIWYARPICIAKARMLVDGYPDGTFRPGEPIIAAEAMKMIVNTFVSDLKNDPKNEHWYDAYWKHLADLDAIPTSVRRADQIMTRGEIVEMIYRTKLNGEKATTDTTTDVR